MSVEPKWKTTHYDERLDDIQKIIQKTEIAIAVINTKLDARDGQDRECWEQVDNRLSRIEERANRHFNLLDTKLNQIQDDLGIIRDKVNKHEIKIAGLGIGIGAVTVSFFSNFDKLINGFKTIIELF